MSAFWKHYEAAKPQVASAVDDVRHKLVEEAWFGRQTTGSIATRPSIEATPEPAEEPEEAPHKHYALYAEIWGAEPKPADLYGTAPTPDNSPGIAPQDPQRGPSPDF